MVSEGFELGYHTSSRTSSSSFDADDLFPTSSSTADGRRHIMLVVDRSSNAESAFEYCVKVIRSGGSGDDSSGGGDDGHRRSKNGAVRDGASRHGNSVEQSREHTPRNGLKNGQHKSDDGNLLSISEHSNSRASSHSAEEQSDIDAADSLSVPSEVRQSSSLDDIGDATLHLCAAVAVSGILNAKRAVADAASLLQRFATRCLDLGIHYEVHVLIGAHVRHEVVRFANNLHPELVALGIKGNGGYDRRIGVMRVRESIQAHVGRRCNSPVVLVRSKTVNRTLQR